MTGFSYIWFGCMSQIFYDWLQMIIKNNDLVLFGVSKTDNLTED
jgi:hypothetical protein